jgi:hypothetical protein
MDNEPQGQAGKRVDDSFSLKIAVSGEAALSGF